MHETYRLLGEVHDRDLERDAEKFRRAAELPRRRRSRAAVTTERPRSRFRTLLARLVGA
jgi:hypothetical protein